MIPSPLDQMSEQDRDDRAAVKVDARYRPESLETPLPDVDSAVDPAPTGGSEASVHVRTPKVLVVVVNYRVPDLTVDCLQSLADERAAGSSFDVSVVENASGDDSAERISAAVRDRGWGDWITVQAAERNGGFAAGNNVAIAPALAADIPPDYVLLLNPDTIVRPDAIRVLVDFLEQHPKIGIAGSQLEDLDGTVQRSAFRFPNILGEFESTVRVGPVTKLLFPWVVAPPSPPGQCQVDWVCGACMLVRRGVFDAIGLLDETYFMYYEEVDYCRRALSAGWSCWFVPEARVVHLVGKSSGVFDPARARRRRPAYWFHSRQRYFRSHKGVLGGALADVAWMAGLVLYRTRRAIDRRPDYDPVRLFRDFLRHSYVGTRQ